MGCINTNPVIKVKSVKSFKKKVKIDLKQDESEDLADKIFSFSDFTIEETDDSNSVDKQSQISINARVENNELIFN